MTTAEQYNNDGLLQARQSRFVEAVAAFSQAVALRPDYAEAHYNLAKALKDSGRLDESITAYRRTLELSPASAAAWQNLANVLQETGRIFDAIQAYQRVIAIEPDNAGAHGMLARLLHQIGQVEQSLPHFQALVRLLPANPEPSHALGVALHDLNRLDEAAEAYRACLAIDPTHVHATYGLGLIHLARGDLATGWQYYEARRRVPGPRAVRDFTQPMWDGSDLRGARILLHAEQGLGDTIQFIRYAPMVSQRGGQVIVRCPPALCRLLANQLAITQALPDGAPLPPFDVHCPLLSLPRVFRTTLEVGSPGTELEFAL